MNDLQNFSTAEKIILTEQLWDSISKDEIEINQNVERELDSRINKVENNTTVLHSWNEIKSHIQSLRK